MASNRRAALEARASALLALVPDVACAKQIAKKGTTPYVTHFHFSAVDEH
jgi:hypothetical protein